MKILFIGDIVARPGRETLAKVLPKVKKKYKPDFVIANAENASHGNGFSPSAIMEMQDAGVDFFTTGDHAWDNKSGASKLDDKDFPVIRPANYPLEDIPGRGWQVAEDHAGHKILVINLMGRVFIKKHFDCPFRALDRILRENAHKKLSAIFVDFHAEATSEKYALGFYADGKVTAVIGTHTHVPTADFRILDGGTAFMADAGMTGSLDSVIGVKKDLMVPSFITQLPVKHEPETKGKMVFNGVLIELDGKTKKALNVLHIQEII